MGPDDAFDRADNDNDNQNDNSRNLAMIVFFYKAVITIIVIVITIIITIIIIIIIIITTMMMFITGLPAAALGCLCLRHSQLPQGKSSRPVFYSKKRESSSVIIGTLS